MDSPVGLREDRGVGDDSSVLRVVDTTQNQLATGAMVGVLAQPERENVLVNEVLVHDVVPDRGNSIFGDALEGKTEDTVESSSDEGDSRLGGGLSEGLVGNFKVGNVEDISRKESGEASSSILDRELLAIGLVGRRCGGVVLVVGLAGNISTPAGGRRNPKVGGPSVKDDSEVLGGAPEGDGAVVLGVTQIDKIDAVGLLFHTITVTKGVDARGHLDVVVLGGGHGDPDKAGEARRHQKREQANFHHGS